MSRVGLFLLFIVGLSSLGFSQSAIITTYVGPALPVNGALAIDQAIDVPQSVAPDGAGGFYVTSVSQSRIYRVSTDGMLSLVAGDGSPGFSGDGGPSPLARLWGPGGVAVDAAGNLFIADTGNNRIRKVTPDCIISTVAGDGTAGFSGDGGLATAAQLSGPTNVAADGAGNLFIADSGNCRIRKVTPEGVISTVAGNGGWGFSGDGGPATSASLSNRESVAVDTAGNLFIADTGNDRIRRVTLDGVISTVAGQANPDCDSLGDDGPATSAHLCDPYGVAVDAAGNLFIAETENARIRKVTPDGMIYRVAGRGSNGFSGDGGRAISAQLDHPYTVAVDTAGNLFIADTGNSRVRKVTPDYVISTVAGRAIVEFGGDGGPATSAHLSYPNGVAVDAASNLFIADSGNGRIRRVTPDGVISTVAGNGKDGFSGDGGAATSAQFRGAVRVAVDAAGNLFIADFANHRVRKVTPDGVISTVAGDGSRGFSGDGGPAISAQLDYPYDVAVDAAGNLFIADTSIYGNWLTHWGSRIRKVTLDGVITTVAGSVTEGYGGDGGPAVSAGLLFPNGVAVDASGSLYIADTGNHRIRKVTPDGVINTVAGNGTQGFSGDGGPATSAQLSHPVSLTADAAGNLFITDNWDQRIRKVTPDGVISTVAGNGTQGFSGDYGPATSAPLNYPSAVAVDASGSLYFSDHYNHRVRRVASGRSVSMDLTLSAGGAETSNTAGEGEAVQPGYAVLAVKSGAAPYGTAVFSFRQNGVTVSEAGVPASPPTTSARIFIDYRSAVPAVPARLETGTIDINTGIAVVNPGYRTAHVTYLLRNLQGATLSSGRGTIAGGAHFAKFIDQMNDVASGLNLPPDFPTATGFGSLEISSDQPLSIVALRETLNQRHEALFTTTPIADLSQPLGTDPIYFPQFVDGGGYTTALVLLNTSAAVETGTLQTFDDNGAPLAVNQVGGTTDSSFKYSIPIGGVFRFQTDGFPASARAGWVLLKPDVGTSTPVGAGVFNYSSGGVLAIESGIPAAVSTTYARVYVDLSPGHDTGLAIANPASTSTDIAVKAYRTDGVTPIGTSQGPLQLPGNGHSAKFATELIAGLPAGFTGVLEITSATPFAALTLRSLNNERNDFLMTTFPIADADRAAPSPVVFPQIADGGGFVTEFILLNAGGASKTTLSFFDNEGRQLAVGK